MADYEDYEMQQKIEDLDTMERVLRAKQARDFGRAANGAVISGISEALKEAGLDERDWASIYHADPQTTLAKQKQQAKKFAEKIIRKTKAGKSGERNAQGRFSAQQGEKPSSGSVTEVREAHRSGKISSDQALDKIVDAALGDYFRTII